MNLKKWIRTALISMLAIFAGNALASSHREAPIVALDHKADITDFFAFVSYDDPTKATFILNVDPLLEPSNGPNYFPFDPEINYTILIDNDHDAEEDIGFQFRFNTEIRLPKVFASAIGALSGLVAPDNAPLDSEGNPTQGNLIIPPAITALDGLGSEGRNLRQTYSVAMIRYGRRGKEIDRVDLRGDAPLYAVPSNVGPIVMPEYPSLVEQGIYPLDQDIKVFAGTVDDPFWIDLGAAIDALVFRPGAFPETGIFGILGDTQDADHEHNHAPDDVSGFNVNAIAIEVPIELITADGKTHTSDRPKATIGAWGTTSRPQLKRFSKNPGEPARLSKRFTQIQRMANPLINELIIGIGDKDKFSMSHPKDDAQFSEYFLDPLLARVLNTLYGGFVSVPNPPRTDLLPLVRYQPPIAAPGTPAGPVADLLRLNTGIAPTPSDQRSRLGLLGGDPAGFPNGRRVSDDVTDIAARVVAGVLAGPSFDNFPNNRIGDGVNTNDVEYRETFPYLGLAHSGSESRHIDPGEAGCFSGICPSRFPSTTGP